MHLRYCYNYSHNIYPDCCPYIYATNIPSCKPLTQAHINNTSLPREQQEALKMAEAEKEEVIKLEESIKVCIHQQYVNNT